MTPSWMDQEVSIENLAKPEIRMQKKDFLKIVLCSPVEYSSLLSPDNLLRALLGDQLQL